MTRIAVCPGSFDPLSRGHEDVVRRALSFADRVVVAVSYAPTHAKQGMFSVDERVEMIRETFADEPRVEAASFQGLVVRFAEEIGARLLVRGVRTVADFEYEGQMAVMNRQIGGGIETLMMMPDPAHAHVSSTLIRQIAALGGDVSAYVPDAVFRRIRARFGGETA